MTDTTTDSTTVTTPADIGSATSRDRGLLAPNSGASDRGWRRSVVRGFFALVAAVLILGQLVRLIFGEGPVAGPRGSAHSTDGSGVAALAELAGKFDHQVIRYHHPLSEIDVLGAFPIVSTSTLVVLAAHLDDKAVAHVEEFVRSGGTLIADAAAANDWLAKIAPLHDYMSAYRGEQVVVFDEPTAVQKQAVDAFGAMSDGSSFALRVLGDASFGNEPDPTSDGVSEVARRDGRLIGLRVGVDAGTVVALSDASMLSNDLLDQADNASFALDLLRGHRTVVFAEEPHGYGAKLDSTGLPFPVRWFLGGLVFSALVLMWSRSRRNGPAEERMRPLAPARSLYLLSLAGEVDRATRPRGLRRFARRTDPKPHQHDPTRNDPTRNDPTRNDPTRNDPTRNDPTRNDPTRNDPTRNETSGNA